MASAFFDSNSEIQVLDYHGLAVTGQGFSSFTSSDCPSLSSSLSIDHLTLSESNGHRQQSVASSSSWEPGQSFSVSSLDMTPPTTPIKGIAQPALVMSECHSLPMIGDFDSGYGFSTMEQQYTSFDAQASFPKWFDESSLYSEEHVLATPYTHHQLHEFPYPFDNRYNPCLSRPIFPEDSMDPASNKKSTIDTSPWIAETMDPSKALLEPITPPRPYNTSPMSPMALDTYAPTPVQIKTAPIGLFSPLELKSQRRSVRSTKKVIKRAGSLLNSLPPVIKASNKFRCDNPDCKDKAFKRAEHLKRHMKCHSDDKPFKCELCGKGFSRSDNRRAHYGTHRNKAKKRNEYFAECDPESNRFKYGKKASASKGRGAVRSTP